MTMGTFVLKQENQILIESIGTQVESVKLFTVGEIAIQTRTLAIINSQVDLKTVYGGHLYNI